MKFKLGSSSNGWKDFDLQDGATEDQKNQHAEDNRRLSQFIVDILLSENLVILTGLGASLSVSTQSPVSGQITYPAPKMSDLWNAIKTKNSKTFKSIIQKTKFDEKTENIESLLSKCQLVLKLNEDDKETEEFLKSAAQIIVEKCNFVDGDADVSTHEMFLRKVGRRSARLPRTQVFTTNYDLCFERAAARTKFIINDGFSFNVAREFDGTYFNLDIVNRSLAGEHSTPEFISNVIHFHKLHGSIDWKQDSSGAVTKAVGPVADPCIIYPQDGKYESSYTAPYLELMARFQNCLRKPNVGLLIIGFGFNDNHLSHPIVQAVKSNVHMKVLVVDPALENSKNSHLTQLSSLIDAGDWRVGMVAGKFEGFTTILPDIVRESDVDRHFERTKGIR